MFIVLVELVVEGKSRIQKGISSINRTTLILNSAKGTAITFFTTNDAKQAKDLLTVLREAKQQIPPELADMARSGGFGGGGRYGASRGRGGPRGGGGRNDGKLCH